MLVDYSDSDDYEPPVQKKHQGILVNPIPKVDTTSLELQKTQKHQPWLRIIFAIRSAKNGKSD